MNLEKGEGRMEGEEARRRIDVDIDIDTDTDTDTDGDIDIDIDIDIPPSSMCSILVIYLPTQVSIISSYQREISTCWADLGMDDPSLLNHDKFIKTTIKP